MLSPKPLKKGSKVTILSTARKISRQEIMPAVELFDSWGLKVELAANLFRVNNQFAGTAEERIEDLQKALDDPECEAIICARGGYGTVQLIDHMNFGKFVEKPKWIVGYSDVTVLHAHLQQVVGCESIHAAMPIDISGSEKQDKSFESLKNVLFGNDPEYQFESRSALNRKGTASAELVGGNLSILYSLTGTKSSLDTQGKILVIEDLDEYLYHIDRMMMNLKRAGMLEELAGLLVGGMSSMNDNLVPFGKTAEEIIFDHVKEYSFPLGFGFPVGHLKENYSLILGRHIKYTVSDEQINIMF